MKKVVTHIFHADSSSTGTGFHVSERIRRVPCWLASSTRAVTKCSLSLNQRPI